MCTDSFAFQSNDLLIYVYSVVKDTETNDIFIIEPHVNTFGNILESKQLLAEARFGKICAHPNVRSNNILFFLFHILLIEGNVQSKSNFTSDMQYADSLCTRCHASEQD